MGLLDDAIREHLELKRRRGADPAEVERLEREALGPVRRAPHATGDAVFDQQTADRGAYPEEADEVAQNARPEGRERAHGRQPFDAQADEWEMDEFAAAEQAHGPTEPLDAGGHETHPPDREAEWNRDLGAPASPVAASAGPPAAEQDGQETVEYDVEAAGADQPEAAQEDDVLEETPEFLQDTPDHDRLWFEQRPPRDFDFEG
jgi:hypothetical protein